MTSIVGDGGPVVSPTIVTGASPTGPAGGDLGGTYPNPTVNDGADSTAIHDNIAGEIAAITLKGTPVAADLLVIEDSADSNNKKRVTASTIGALGAGGTAGGDLSGTYPNPTVNDGADSTAIHDNVAGEIAAITLKATPVSADVLVIEDSAAANAKKRVTVGSITSASAAPSFGVLSGCSHARASATSVTVGQGFARDNADTLWLEVGSSGLTCDLTTTGAGGLDTGSLANNTVYAIWLVDNSGATAVVASTSFTLAGITGFTVGRRVGAFATDGSANVRTYVAYGRGTDRVVEWTESIANRTMLSAAGNVAVTNVTNSARFIFPSSPWIDVHAQFLASTVNGNGFFYGSGGVTDQQQITNQSGSSYDLQERRCEIVSGAVLVYRTGSGTNQLTLLALRTGDICWPA